MYLLYDSNHCWASVNTSNKVHLILFVRKKRTLILHTRRCQAIKEVMMLLFFLSLGAANWFNSRLRPNQGHFGTFQISHRPTHVVHLEEVFLGCQRWMPKWLHFWLAVSLTQHLRAALKRVQPHREPSQRSRCNDISGFTIRKGERAFDYFFLFSPAVQR